MFPIPLANNPDGVTIPVIVVPGASRREVAGGHGDRLRVRVTAPPEKGRANKEVAALLAELFGVPARLIKGESSRRKLFLLRGIDKAQVQRIVDTLPPER